MKDIARKKFFGAENFFPCDYAFIFNKRGKFKLIKGLKGKEKIFYDGQCGRVVGSRRAG